MAGALAHARRCRPPRARDAAPRAGADEERVRRRRRRLRPLEDRPARGPVTLQSLPAVSARAVPALGAVQMAEADRRASEELGIPLAVLMENAARQIAATARAFMDEVEGQVVSALVGVGNNGGDALGALRHLLGWGAEVDAFVTAPPDRLRPLARAQYDILKKLGVPLYDTTALDDRFIVHRLRARHLVLDGLLGYSARGA